MDARGGGRHYSSHNHGRHGGNGGGGGYGNKRFQRGGGGGSGGGGRGFHGHHGHNSYNNHNGHNGGRGSFWFKGEGYNDFEAVSIEEEVVGIHGFLTPEQPGFPGQVKQRYSDFVVHELAATNGQPVALTSLITKKRTVQASFTDLVSGFAFGSTESSSSSKDAADTTPRDPAMFECLKLIRQLARDVAHRASTRAKIGQDALESYNQRKLVELVTSELGAKMGGEFATFFDTVKSRKQALVDAKASGASLPHDETSTEDPPQFFVAGLNEKSDRVFIHETMRRYGKNMIVADTITSPDLSQVIRIRPTPVTGVRKGERDPRRDWPVDRPDYTQFVIYKRNKEIVAVVNQIASVLKVNPSLFSYADVKDKRGITTQHCTVYRVPKERFHVFVRQSGRNLDDQNYLVGNLKYVAKKLGAGDCRGNAFSIVLRGIPDATRLNTRTLDGAVAQWQSRGFINFFGIQRFGGSATPHHILGRALLRKDFKMAVLLLLRPQEGEASKVRQAREHFRQHKDVAAALRMLPPFLIPERAVLEGLLQHGMEANELAFRGIPVHLRFAYVEAYQYYVWNQMASLRVDQHSRTRAIVGDLVLVDDDEPHTEQLDQATAMANVSPSTVVLPRRRVIALTPENVDKFMIDDVVLPLPGFQIMYPANHIGVAYQKLLAMDGVDLASWESATQSANHHPYDLKGSYRHVVKKPQHVSVAVQNYVDATQPLLLNDVDVMQGRTAPLDQRLATTTLQPGEKKSTSFAAPLEPTSDACDSRVATHANRNDTKKHAPGRALILNFRLEYGSDATIAVRELLKQSSSMHVQMQLSDGAERASAAKISAAGGGLKSTKAATSAGGASSAGGGGGGKKRPSGTVLSGTKPKEIKVVASKKTQVAIGRPGFSLGKY